MSPYEIISITISSIGLVSIIIMAISLIVSIHSSNQLRKSKAAKAVSYYIDSTAGSVSISVWIVSSFSREQCECLHKVNDLVVDVKELDKICYICPHRDFCINAGNQKLCTKKGDSIMLNKDVVYYIRDNVFRYLNNLEYAICCTQLQPMVELNEFIFRSQQRIN